MAACTYGIGAAPRKTKQRSEKGLQATPICYCIENSTLKTPLTFNKVEKTKHESFAFVHISFFFFYSIKYYSKSVRFVNIGNIPNIWSITLDYSYWFSASCELRLASIGLETVDNTLRVLLGTLLAFNAIYNCVGVARMVRPHSDS